MDKATFLKKLKGELFWRVPPKELREILRGYQDYFAKAAAGGIREAEAAQELGEPTLVAVEILSERYGGATKRSFPGLLFAAAVLGFAAYTYVISPYIGTARYFFEQSGAGLLHALQLLLLTPTVLAALTYPRIRGAQAVPATGLLLANGVVWLAGALGFIAIRRMGFGALIQLEQLGSLLANILLCTAVLLVIFTFLALLRVAHGGVMAIPLLYLNCTGLWGIYRYMGVLHTMSDLSHYPLELNRLAQYVLLGLAITGAVTIFLHIRERRRAAL